MTISDWPLGVQLATYSRAPFGERTMVLAILPTEIVSMMVLVAVLMIRIESWFVALLLLTT